MTRRVVSIPHTEEHLNLAGEFLAGRGGTHTLSFDEYISMVRAFQQLASDYVKRSRRVVVAVLVGLTLTGCGSGGGGICATNPTTVASTGDDNETKIIAETLRFAGQLSLRVTGQLTDYEYRVGSSLASGWYVGDYGKNARGTAYYYQPHVLNMGRVVDGAFWETVTNVAGHETCHGLTGAPHDRKHWECMARVAQPTYPDPGSGTASSSSSYRRGACAQERISREK